MVSKQNKHSFSCVVLFDDLIKNECYFDYLGTLVIVLDEKGRIKVFNKVAEELTSYKKEEVLNKKWIPIFVPKKIRKDVNNAFLELVKGNVKKIEDYTNPILAKDGREIIIRWSNKLVYNSSNEFKGVISTGTDITELVNKDHDIEETRDFYMGIIDNLPNPIWKADVHAKCDYFNKSWLGFTGRDLKDELGDGWAQGVHRDDFDRCVKIYLDSFKNRKSFYMEYRLKYNDGSYHWLADYGKPIYSLRGEFMGYIGSCYDINESKEMVEAQDKKSKELEKINALMVGRELKMIELKEKIRKLENEKS